MDAITFFDMLGIDPGSGTPDPAAVAAAAALWPDKTVSRTPGFSVNDDSADTTAIVLFLQGDVAGRTVQFLNVRTGVDGFTTVGSGLGQFTIAADLVVNGAMAPGPENTFYFRQLPDIGVSLFPTKPGSPARCFFAKDSRGWELILEALPVIITLKAGLVEPMDPNVPFEGDDPTDFNPEELDSFIVVRNQNPQGTLIYTSVRVHIRPGGDVIFEPNIPVSQPSSRFLGLPVKAMYDFLIIPSPGNREYYEWARNDLSNFLAPVPVSGAIGFRSLDFDLSQPPFSDLAKSLQSGAIHTEQIELVCEDAVFPLSLGLPLPSHGTFGFRRKIVDRSSLANAFSFVGAPVIIRLYPRPSDSSDQAASPEQLQLGVAKGWFLSIDEVLLQSGEPPVIAFKATFIWQGESGTTVGGSIAIADDWTVQLGIVLGDASPAKFTVVDNTVSIHGAKLGLGIGHMMRQVPFSDSWQILADLSIQGKPSQGTSSWFKLRSLTGKPLSLILRDIGWSFGHPSIDGLTFPEGVQLILFDTLRLIVVDMGWLEEPSGTSYFSFSGGIGLGFGGGDAIQPSGSPTYGTSTDLSAQRASSDGFAIQVRRLRFRTNDDSSQPSWKMDGLSLSLKYGTLLVSGFGFFSEDEENGWHVREMGFGVQVQADLLGATWNLAAQFIKGHRYLIADESTAFDYFLAALSVGFLPAGSVGLYSVRLLMANNMTPNTDPNASDGQGMVLYKWHRDHDTAIDLPRDRNLGDWNAVDNTLAFGIGCGFSFNGGGSVFHINVFVFYSQSEQERGLLVVGELFLLKNPKPIAFVAIEYDLDTNKFGILAGINLKLADFLQAGNVPSWMKNLVNLTGNIYFGNQPWTLAIGQLADPRTWLAVSVKFDGFSFVFAMCFECVDGGPKGGGFLFTLTFNLEMFHSQFSIYGGVGISIGNWKTGSDATGFEAFAQLGFKIYVFHILHIGLDATVKYSFLGKHPWYKAYSVTLRIDTPWWMPDVSFSIDKSWNEQLPYDVALLTRPVSSGSAMGLGQTKEIALLAPPLSDGDSDPALLYSFNNFVHVSGNPLGDVHLRTDIPIVETSASIAINFTNAVSNDMGVASDTYGPLGDAGVQTVKDLTVRYALKSIAVRRSPRYGPGAGTWTDLVTPTDTALDTSGNSVQLAPALAFRWDADSRADGSLSPKRLLLNSSTPYTFSTGASQNDEEAMRNDPGYPCCNTGDAIKRYFPRAHVLTFATASPGVRLPARQQFSLQGVWWQWTTVPLPVASAGTTPATSNTVVATTHPPAGAIGSAELSDPAVKADCAISWTAAASATVFFEGYAGLKLVARQQASLTVAGSVVLSLSAPQDQGMTRLLLRIDGPPVFPAYLLQVEQVNYFTAAENGRYIGQVARCGSMASTGGKLAFLPNTDYEVTVVTETKVSTTSQGERSSTLSDVVYFRTKGLPGLNSVANAGDEVEPYIESLYPPAQAILLYREEPVVLAFTEGMSSILPVDRVSAPTDPPEKTQAMELVLNIDRVGSTSGLARLTVSSLDWIDAHRATPPTRRFPRPIVEGVDSKMGVRKATSLDPLTLRYVALQAASTVCTVDPLRASQVLIHEPVGADNAAGPWEPSTTLRASVRQKDGPYTQRHSFDVLDSGAFLSQADGTASPAGAWTVDASYNLVAPAAGPGRQYASFGELTWNHIQVQAQFDPQGSAAGLAIGVPGGNPVPQTILATVEPDPAGTSLVLRSLSGGVETELARSPIKVSGVVVLTVYAFDDTVRAVAAEVTVEASRWAIREGRVALVASGPAKFSALSVDSLDLYHFDFSSSRYQSFTAHIQSWNGKLPEIAESAAGGTSAPLSTLLAADVTAIASAMQPSADPQARQALFTQWTTALGLPLLAQPLGISLTRWTGTDGTLAILLESPEAISFTRDVTVLLIHHLPPAVWHPIGPANFQAALSHLQFSGTSVTVSQIFAIFGAGDLIVHVTQPVAGPTFAIYTAPQHGLLVPIPGKLQEVVTPKTGTDLLLDQMRSFPNGTNVLVRNKAIVAAANSGIGTGPADQPVPLIILDNGPETAALLMPASANGNLTPLPSGKYTLHLAINRPRWRETNSTNSEALYAQQQSLDLIW